MSVKLLLLTFKYFILVVKPVKSPVNALFVQIRLSRLVLLLVSSLSNLLRLQSSRVSALHPLISSFVRLQFEQLSVFRELSVAILISPRLVLSSKSSLSSKELLLASKLVSSL